MARATVKKDDGTAGRGGNSERPRKPREGKALAAAPPPREATAGDKYQNWVEEARKYLKNVQAEAKRIAWPTQQQLKAFVAVVLVTLIVVTFYLYVCDTVFTKLFTWIIHLLHGSSPAST